MFKSRSDAPQWQAAPTISQLQVLIFGDDAPGRSALRQALKEIGIVRTIEASTRDAPKARMQSRVAIDVILCDLELASGSGLALLKAIRLGNIGGIRSDVCLIFVSDVVDPAAVAAAAKLDASGYLIKPVVPSRLRAAILRGHRKAINPNLQKYAFAPVGRGPCPSISSGLSPALRQPAVSRLSSPSIHRV